jgi:hypothetical protein
MNDSMQGGWAQVSASVLLFGPKLILGIAILVMGNFGRKWIGKVSDRLLDQQSSTGGLSGIASIGQSLDRTLGWAPCACGPPCP